jgi:uncharacterized membrane protein
MLGNSSNPQTSTTIISLGLILLLALLLRVHHIGRESFWFDEIATVRIVKQDTAAMFSSIKWDERIPPLHYVILHGWVRVFGDSEFSMRLPSALAGTAAVWAVYRLASQLFGGSVGLIAALLMAVSRAQIVYSQEARAYSLLVLLSLLSCDVFVRLIRQPTPRRELAYVIVSALLLYSHLYGVFALAAQHLAYLILLATRRPVGLAPRRWVTLTVAVVALFSPWIPIAVRWVRSVGTAFWQTRMTGDDIAETYRLYLGSAAMTVACVALVVMGVARFRRHYGLPLVLALATLPVVVPIIVSILTKPTFTYRYALFAPAAVFILVACGVMALPGRTTRLFVAILLVGLSFAGRALTGEKPDWRGVIAYVGERARPRDYVIFHPRLTTYLYDHYARRTDVHRKGFDTGTIPLGLPRPEGETVWLVYDPRSSMMNDVLRRGNWRVISHRGFRGAIVVELDDDDQQQ